MSAHSWFADRTAVLATMHYKERVIAPILNRELGVRVIVPAHFDTDRFGIFTRDIARAGNQLEAARHKAEKVLEATGESLAIASEGSFFPHPAFPFVACDRDCKERTTRELVLLCDRVNNLEIVGEELSTKTNYAHKAVQTVEEALEFAQKVGFPEHALVVMTDRDTCYRQEIYKGINQQTKLIEILKELNLPIRLSACIVILRLNKNLNQLAQIKKTKIDLSSLVSVQILARVLDRP